jgi:hypothetical protein
MALLSLTSTDTKIAEMKIRYKKKRNTFYLIMITFWVALIISSFVFGDFDGWTDYTVVALGTIYTIIYSFNYTNQYLTIENGTIRRNTPFSKKISLSEIKIFKKFAGEYILKTDSSELRINTSLIDQFSLAELDKALASLNIN